MRKRVALDQDERENDLQVLKAELRRDWWERQDCELGDQPADDE